MQGKVSSSRSTQQTHASIPSSSSDSELQQASSARVREGAGVRGHVTGPGLLRELARDQILLAREQQAHDHATQSRRVEAPRAVQNNRAGVQDVRSLVRDDRRSVGGGERDEARRRERVQPIRHVERSVEEGRPDFGEASVRLDDDALVARVGTVAVKFVEVNLGHVHAALVHAGAVASPARRCWRGTCLVEKRCGNLRADGGSNAQAS